MTALRPIERSFSHFLGSDRRHAGLTRAYRDLQLQDALILDVLCRIDVPVRGMYGTRGNAHHRTLGDIAAIFLLCWDTQHVLELAGYKANLTPRCFLAPGLVCQFGFRIEPLDPHTRI